MTIQHYKWIVLMLLFLPTALSFAHPDKMPHGNMQYDEMEEMMQSRGHGPMNPMMGGGYMMGGAMGGGYMGGGHMMGGPRMNPLFGNLRGLGLTKEQRKKIRGLQREMRKKHLAMMDAMGEISDELMDLYAADIPDADKIGVQYGKLFEIRRNMIVQRIELRNEVYALLTKSQKEKAQKRDPYYGRHRMMNE